jgi:hypothetical protein
VLLPVITERPQVRNRVQIGMQTYSVVPAIGIVATVASASAMGSTQSCDRVAVGRVQSATMYAACCGQRREAYWSIGQPVGTLLHLADCTRYHQESATTPD